MMSPALLALSLSLSVVAPAPPPAPAPMPSDSLYQVDGAFEDQNGKRHALAELAGHPTIFAMFYATCPRACPLLIDDVKRVLKRLAAEDADSDVRVVLVSLDPDNDTAAVLASTMQTRALAPERFTMLRTDATTTRTLATALGVRYRQAGGSIEHTSKLVLLDRRGVTVAERVPGAGAEGAADADAFVAAIRAVR